MPDFDGVWDKCEPIIFPIDKNEVDFVQHGDFRNDPLLEPLGTASGKIEIYCKNIEKMAYADCGPTRSGMNRLNGWAHQGPGISTSFGHPSSPLPAALPIQSVWVINRYLQRGGSREPVTINTEDAKEREISRTAM